MPRAQILVIDDEPLMRDFLEETLFRAGYELITAADGNAGLDEIKNNAFDLIVTDLKMPGIDGLELLSNVKRIQPDTSVVIMTAYASVETAVQALKAGAADYIMKPFTPDEIEHVVRKALYERKLENENRYLRSEIEQSFNFQEMVGSSQAMLAIYDQIKKISQSKASVLIRGESGTGKELIARAIHYASPRKDKPFIKINCAALAPTLLESELFGHEKGSFTHAINKKIGRFELADEGTLLLDEIGEMDPGLQSKLLRVLQEKEFERVGGTKPIKVDARIISTTNRDLETAIEQQRFREDLYFRLNVIPIKITPLRDRKEDIPALAQHFLKKHALENNDQMKKLDPEALALLMRHNWPGNVRELENCIERAVVLCPGESITPEYFAFPLQKTRPQSSDGVFLPESATIGEAERLMILHTLKRTNNNKTRTAEILDISVRTLRNKLKEYRENGLAEAVSSDEG
ncbi:MAG: sigma-54-dependent Fis family transcriptional regulator [Candidatus Abyssobacteria bacterium SURF_5]|uniref:Sigma-54-dependent Fis family transcriptional regulator n=1 Tax=Abyssobacteria bacterium (strain SURF_5) TaxID=2093360 RepID=A0A3A4MY30_ABYX5|nr:MAG: sigma-54-dependent Fis family transcriptional regulator [Candidatus Abyssubacteria bacterium SURF_5]